ncbi:MAG: hypothetical protein IPH11_02195 [Ignavibacteriales bacterium]|nr:hypothetical protein [Ignavibacteriales bacterium]
MSRFNHYPIKPSNQYLLSSYYILCGAHEAASSFLDTFETIRTTRGAKGAPTDVEQNQIRAMLIFSSSGLDSMVKQLVKDSLGLIIEKNEGAQKMFESYIEKRLKKTDELDLKFLSKLFATQQPQIILIQDLVNSICSASLQSKEQLLKVAASFDIPTHEISTDLKNLKKYFMQGIKLLTKWMLILHNLIEVGDQDRNK